MQSLSHNENYLVASDVELFSKVPDSEYASLAYRYFTAILKHQCLLRWNKVVLLESAKRFELTEKW